jgi:hypothetical protein
MGEREEFALTYKCVPKPENGKAHVEIASVNFKRRHAADRPRHHHEPCPPNCVRGHSRAERVLGFMMKPTPSPRRVLAAYSPRTQPLTCGFIRLPVTGVRWMLVARPPQAVVAPGRRWRWCTRAVPAAKVVILAAYAGRTHDVRGAVACWMGPDHHRLKAPIPARWFPSLICEVDAPCPQPTSHAEGPAQATDGAPARAPADASSASRMRRLCWTRSKRRSR